MSQPKKKDNVTRNLVIAMIALVVLTPLIVFGVQSLTSKSSSSKSVSTPSSVDAAEGYGIVFNKGLTGVPKLDIWEDFQCPVCKDFESVNGGQLKDWIANKKVVAVFHPLSFIGAESAYMANAAACSADEGKFLQIHEALYANQASKENSGQWNPQSLIGLGLQLKINSATWSECVTKAKYQDWVNKIAADGSKKNVNSTPTVFINGKEMERNAANYFTTAGFKAQVFK